MYPSPSPTSWLWGNYPKASKLCAGLGWQPGGCLQTPTLPTRTRSQTFCFTSWRTLTLFWNTWMWPQSPPSLLAQKVPQAQCSWKRSWTPTSRLIQTQTWNSLPPLPANCLLLGWPKSSFGFKVWIKVTFFIFTKNFIEQCIHHFFPYYVLPFSRQLHNLIFPKLLIFLSKELF